MLTLLVLLSQSQVSSADRFAFPPFLLVREEYIEGVHVATFELEWRGRNDWTERLMWTSGGKPPGLTQEVRDGVLTHFNGVSSTSATIERDGNQIPGVWFMDFGGAIAGASLSNPTTATIGLGRPDIPLNAEEWDLDRQTGIPVGYRQIASGIVVRQSRVVSLVLDDGTVIR